MFVCRLDCVPEWAKSSQEPIRLDTIGYHLIRTIWSRCNNIWVVFDSCLELAPYRAEAGSSTGCPYRLLLHDFAADHRVWWLKCVSNSCKILKIAFQTEAFLAPNLTDILLLILGYSPMESEKCQNDKLKCSGHIRLARLLSLLWRQWQWISLSMILFFILLCVELAYKHVERAEGWWKWNCRNCPFCWKSIVSRTH